MNEPISVMDRRGMERHDSGMGEWVYLLLNFVIFIYKNNIMGKFIITEEEKKSIRNMYLLEQITMSKSLSPYTGDSRGFLWDVSINTPLVSKIRKGTSMCNRISSDVASGNIRFFYVIPKNLTSLSFTVKGTTSSGGSGSYMGATENVSKEIYNKTFGPFSFTNQTNSEFYFGSFDFTIPTNIKSENIIFYEIIPSDNTNASLKVQVTNK